MMKNKQSKHEDIHEEVEFSHELADSADMDAVKRMKEANKRAQMKGKKEM